MTEEITLLFDTLKTEDDIEIKILFSKINMNFRELELFKYEKYLSLSPLSESITRSRISVTLRNIKIANFLAKHITVLQALCKI